MPTTPQHLIPHWYIPSFYGDIRLEAVSTTQCRVIADQTTERERAALRTLAEVASKRRWLPTSKGPTPLFSDERALKTTLDAPIDKVAKQLAKLLKPRRKVISAVKFKDGTIEEIFDDEVDVDTTKNPYREPAAMPPEHAVAAASVAAPTRGCPAPDFGTAELRARGVLATFLSTDQLDDFALHNRFVTIGADTGHHYMVTSRQATDALATYQRTLYDLDEGRALCVHDWSVPPAEEMLSMHVLLALPDWERFLRHEEHDVELAPELWAMHSGAVLQ
jgi:hypothetical protein